MKNFDYDIFIVLNMINPPINHHYFLITLYIDKELNYSNYPIINKLINEFNLRINESFYNNCHDLYDIKLNPLIDIKKYINNLINFLDENSILHNDIKLK